MRFARRRITAVAAAATVTVAVLSGSCFSASAGPAPVRGSAVEAIAAPSQPVTVSWLGGAPTSPAWNVSLGTGTPGPPAFASLPNGVQVRSAAIGVDGAGTVLAIGTDGNLYAWGANENGELGDGTSQSRTTPEQVSLPGGVAPAQVAANEGTSYVIGANGALYAAGLNNLGQLGDGSSANTSDTFQAVSLPSGVTATSVAAAGDFALAAGSDGKAYAWGVDQNGELGDDTYLGASSDTPQVVPLPSGVTAVAVQAGWLNGYALTSAGTAYSWGANTVMLGNATAEGLSSNVSGPVAVEMAAGVTISSFSVTPDEASLDGGDGLAIASNGNLYGWGFNTAGELGDGTQGTAGVPEELLLPGGAKPSAVSSGPDVSYVVDSSGQIYAAGLNAGYDLGASTAGPDSAESSFEAVAQPAGFLAADVYDGGCGGQGYAPPAACVTAIATGALSDAPYFTADAPPSALASGSSIDYTFAAGGDPAPTYALSAGAPSWLSIDSTTGELTGTAPAGYGYAFYSVLARSSTGTTTAGPFYLSDPNAQATVSGTVSGAEVSGGNVEVCVNGTALCSRTALGADGAYSLPAVVGTTVTVTAHPPQGWNEAAVSLDGLVITSGGLSGENLTLSTLVSLPVNLGLASFNVGQPIGSLPQTVWSDSSRVTYTGCPYGAGIVSVIGRTGATGDWTSNTAALAESPPGSGYYVGTIPPQIPIHGQVEISPQILCAFGSRGFLPSSGSPNGGNTVTILGSGFTGATSVRFGSTPASNVTVLGDQGIQVTAPAGDGTVPVEVMTPSGTQNAGSYTYDPDAIDLNDPGLVGPTNLTDLLASTLEEINPQLVNGYQLGGSLQSLATTALHDGGGCMLGEAGAEKVIGAAAAAALADTGLPELAEASLGVDLESATTADSAATRAIYGAPARAGLDTMLDHLNDAISKPLAEAAMAQLGCPPPDLQPNALIDPSGNVLDTNGNPIAGATVTILRSDAFAGPFAAVDPSSAGIAPNVNPETSDASGTFMWDVDSGYYEVQARAAGCANPLSPALEDSTIGPYPVPPPQVGLTVTMACSGEPPPPTPAVTALSPTTGTVAGGTRVLITGAGFTPDSTVDFGSAPATDTAYLSPHALEVTAPAGAGSEDVTVTTAGGTSATSSADRFFYGSAPTVTGLSVTQGPTAGGTALTITGTGFTGATEVAFADLPAASFTVQSDGAIAAITPEGLPGTVDVIVVTPAGGSAASSADRFTFSAPVTSGSGGGPQGTPTGSPPVATSALVRLGKPTKVSATGRLRVKAACPRGAARCADTVSLRVTVVVRHGKRRRKRTITIAVEHVKLAPGKTETLAVKLSKTGLSLLKKAKHHKLRVVALVTAGARTHEETLTLKLR